MKQLEFGEHLSPTFIPIFTKLYNRLIVESQKYLHLFNEYTMVATLPPSTIGDVINDDNNGDDSPITKKQGRKRRDPEKIVKIYEEETRLRNMWYEEQKQQQQTKTQEVSNVLLPSSTH